MADNTVGSVSVKIVPDASSFSRDADRALTPDAQRLGQQLGNILGRQISQDIADAVKDGMRNAPTTAAARSGQQSGADFSRAFADEAKARISAALADLPAANVDIDATEADQELGRLRMELHSLSAHVGVDMDDTEALAKLEDLSARIERLSLEHPDVTVGTHTTDAQASLDSVIARAAELGVMHPTVTVDADTAGADAQIAATGAAAAAAGGSGGVGVLITAAIALSPALVAVGAAGVGAFAAIGAAVGAVGAAFGVALLALKPIMDAYQALNAAKTAGTNGGTNPQVEADKIAAANAQVASSERSLANTRANVADQAVQAAQKVKDAQQNLADVERSTAEQIKNAEQGVANARSQAAQRQQQDLQAIQQAKAQAAQQDQMAEQQVTSAQQSLTQAQQQAVLAQQNLHAARLQAVKDLQQMAFSAADAALSQRQAQLNLTQAQQNYQAVMSNPKSTELQREQAQLALDQAKQALLEQTQAAKDAEAANKKAQKDGIEGDKNVIAAKEAVKKANQNIIDQQKALVEAQRNLVKTQVQGAKSIADAQAKAARDQVASAQAIRQAVQSLDDARYNGARSVQKAQEGVSQAQSAQQQQARQGAFQVQQATAAVTSAQNNLAKAHEKTAVAGTAASKKLADAMSALSPAGKSFLDYIMSIKSSFGDLSKKAQQGFLPGLEKGMKALSPLAKPIEGLVSSLSKAMGGIAESAGKAIGGPQGQKFIKFLSVNLPKWLALASQAAGGFIGGIVNLFEGFGPTATTFLGYFAKMGKSFDQWTAKITKTKGFKDFLAYIAKEGPVVGDFFKNLFVIIGKMMVGLAPLGALMMKAFDWISKLLAKMSPNTLLLIAAAFGVLWFAMTGGIAGVIVAVVALAAWVVNLYKKNQTFRDIVNAVWHGIKTTIKAVVDWLTDTAWPSVKKFFGWLTDGVKSVGSWFKRTWDNIKSSFSGAWDWVKTTWKRMWSGVTGVITGAFTDAKNNLHNNWEMIKGYFKSAWNWVSGVFKNSWSGVKDILAKPIQGVKDLFNREVRGWKAIFKGAKDAIKKIWDGMKSIVKTPISWAVHHVLRPLANGINAIIPGSGPIPTGWMKGFDRGGWTGAGPRMQPAGIVHADEFVVNKPSRRKFESSHPGALDHINRTGELPGFAGGGLVPTTGGSQGGSPMAWSGVEWYRPSWRPALVSEMRRLQGQGWTILEMEPFAKVHSVHDKDSLHYLPTRGAGDAADISRAGMKGADAVAQMLMNMGFGVKWRSPGHYNHIHVDTSMLSEIGGKWLKVKKGGGGGLLGGIFGGLEDKVSGWIDAVTKKFGGTWPGHMVTGPIKAGLPKLWKWAEKMLNPLNWFGGGHKSGELDGGAAELIGKADAAKYGWDKGREWSALYELWQHESGWNPLAKNPSSGAYGIPQSLPASKMAAYGADYLTNPDTQIRWGLDYIKAIYGDPERAWSKWLSRSPHWYLNGSSSTSGGPAWLSEDGRPELVVGKQMRMMQPGDRVYNSADTRRILGGGAEPMVARLSDSQVQVIADAVRAGTAEGSYTGTAQRQADAAQAARMYARSRPGGGD